jgi:predicted nucleotidyltransferase
MGSSGSRLTPLQEAVLDELRVRDTDFFLTGGGVLVGWILRHRTTDDLDLFTTSDESIAGADGLVRSIAASLGAAVEALQSAPDFKRYLISRGNEALKLDFVRDRAPQLHEKTNVDGLRLDPVEEIIVNKLCAIAGRAEVRDLVDLQCLEDAGHDLLSYVPEVLEKDAGATPATLAWLLSSLQLPEQVPGPHTREELLAFARGLESRLRAVAEPSSKG